MTTNLHPLTRMKRFVKILLGAIIVLAATAGNSQTPVSRPKIGLVLNGEGASGFVQLGVLQWFEEHHIPVDYIAGTSVGGWVGGSYAAGVSTQEITDFLGHMNFTESMFFGEAPYQQKGNWEKPEMPKLSPGLSSFQLEAFASSRQPDFLSPLLPEIVGPYSDLRSFDDLPIPFRCVAADLTTGQVVVLDKGSLPEALRASISMIGVSSPVHIGKGSFVSGAILGSIPTDVVRKMGADVVIASSTITPAGVGMGSSMLDSVYGQMMRALDIARETNERKALETADIVIRPDIYNFTTLDLSKVAEFARLGYEAAQQKMASLLKYEVNDSDWKQYVDSRAQRKAVTTSKGKRG
jgi:NTE family protein